MRYFFTVVITAGIEQKMENTIRKLYIEASSRCNMHCKMCFRHSWIGESFGDFNPQVFIQLLEDPAFVPVETVFFGGMGEPLIHPGLAEMVGLAASCGKKVELITNGTLLRKRLIQDLIAAGIDRIWISVDEIYDNYKNIQIGSDFDLIRDNLAQFNCFARVQK